MGLDTRYLPMYLGSTYRSVSHVGRKGREEAAPSLKVPPEIHFLIFPSVSNKRDQVPRVLKSISGFQVN